jgi:hypothetical protein
MIISTNTACYQQDNARKQKAQKVLHLLSVFKVLHNKGTSLFDNSQVF